NYALWFHTIRRRQSAYPGGKAPPGFPSEVDKQWRAKHDHKESFINEHYITVMRKPDTKGAVAVHHYLQKLYEASSKEQRLQATRDAQKELADMVGRITATLKDSGARVLTVTERNGLFYSEPMEFLGRLTNCGYAQPMLMTDMDIAHYLPAYRLYFGD